VPRPDELAPFVSRLDQAAEEILAVADWVAGFAVPSSPRAGEQMALVHPDEYPMNLGTMATASGTTFTAAEYEARATQLEVPHSSARHAVLGTDQHVAVGPLARVNLNAARLTPLAMEAAARLSLKVPETDPFQSLGARVVETALAIDEAARLVAEYVPPTPAHAPVVPLAGRATWITEAPRGPLYHRYDVDASGTVRSALIVPPTCHNLPNMEDDVRRVVSQSLQVDDAELTRLCEMAVRNYDPCISCATHFLRLRVDRRP
jgi:coenzyme F420-reducing hydrogenase alpha subunit